jgi:hypothetical protein
VSPYPSRFISHPILSFALPIINDKKGNKKGDRLLFLMLGSGLAIGKRYIPTSRPYSIP